MTFNIPNIFIAGKKAVAYEVNENFDAVKNQLNKVIRCETCEGTGKVLSPVQNDFIVEDYVIKQRSVNCPDCGGSGVKWNGEVNNAKQI